MTNILTAPNSVLSQKAQQVKKIDKSILQLIEEMKQALLAAKDPEGVGLAAPQVGKPLQIFIMKPTPKSKILVCINPKIRTKSPDLVEIKRPKSSKYKGPKKLEGCLSLPSIWGEVLRSPKVTLWYLDENARPHKKTFTDFIATIIQHEIDHLQGVLFPKRVLEQKGKLYKSHKDEKGQEVFEEIEI